MAFRGRGRGRGFRGDFRFAKQEPFVLFPDIELPDRSNVSKDMEVIRYNHKLRRYYRDSPYYLEESLADEQECMDVERYSDRNKKAGRFRRGSLQDSGFLMLEPGYFPLELLRGTRTRVGRKVQWNPKRDLQKLDILEQLEEKGKDDHSSTKKKEGEEEEEEEDEENPEDDEFSDEGDYEENGGFDDDEDDYNMQDNGDDEPIL